MWNLVILVGTPPNEKCIVLPPPPPFWWQSPLSIRSVGHSFSLSSILIFLATTSAWSLSFSATWCPQKESWVSTCVRPDLASIHNYGTPPFPPINIIITINIIIINITLNTYLLVWLQSCLSNNQNHIIISFSSHSCIQNRKLHGKEADWCPWTTSPSTTFS